MTIERLIGTLRDAHPLMTAIFTRGSCYQLFLILRTVYPQAQCWYDPIVGHVYTCIDGRFYDIRGRIYQLPKALHQLTRDTWPKHAPHRWQALELELVN